MELAGIIPKAIEMILVKKALKLLQSHCFSEKLLRECRRENMQNLFFLSDFELCFVSTFSGKCCCHYVHHMSVSFGESFIIPTLHFQSLPFQTVLKRSLVKRHQVCSGIFWDSGHICTDHVEELIPAAVLSSVFPFQSNLSNCLHLFF